MFLFLFFWTVHQSNVLQRLGFLWQWLGEIVQWCALHFLKRVLLKIICVENTQYRTIVLYITPRPCNDALYNSDCYCWITMYCSTTQTKSLLSLHINSRVNLEALRHKHLNREALTCNIWRICTHMHIIAWPTAHWLDSTYQNSTSKNIPLTFIN